ncbi:MAG: cobyrinate a,c-diamide synthase [Pseudomonadota bacterium]
MRSILIAGTQSGCGKTTATLATMQHLINQGLNVQGFKSGPDFLDPLWHKKLTGNVSYNLDTKMVGILQSQKLLSSAVVNQCDTAIIEGVMGLFDGRTGIGKQGSSAHLAVSLNLEVWLVVDAKGMSGSIVPLVSGFVNFAQKMDLKISGIIANRVGSQHHAGLLKQFLHDENLPPLIAWLDKQTPKLPERHLGLIQPNESPLPDFSDHFHIEQTNLVKLIPNYKPPLTVNISSPKMRGSQNLKGLTISIARDQACCFIYPANINWLNQQGATIQYFSPIKGEAIADNTDALWLPGGYPELYAEQLSSSSTLDSINHFITSGKPVLAECGGMMLLGQSLTDLEGKKWLMANILPITTQMQNKLASLGYRECISGPNMGVKGHEFHHSIRTEIGTNELKTAPAFPVSRGDSGIQQQNIRASYIHWYFASAPEVVTSWFIGKRS